MKSYHYFFLSVLLVLLLLISYPALSQTTDGDLAPLGARDGTVDVGDALVALRFALGLESPTEKDTAHGDVAPLDADGQPQPDGNITVGDALVILRNALGLLEWSIDEDTPTKPSEEGAEGTIIELAGDVVAINGGGVTVDGSTAVITSAGIYTISGDLDDGRVLVNTEDAGTVRLRLNGVHINCSDNSPIHILSAESVVIYLVDGTDNYVSDGISYTYEDPEADEPDAAVFSKSDLTIAGNGSLSVVGNYNNGIKSKDGLIIKSGSITITSVDDGIIGRDYIIVENGDITVTAEGDGFKATNDEDTDRGYITIEGGIINIVSGADALQAETDILITGGDFVLTCGGGRDAYISEEASAKGIKATFDITIDDGDFIIDAADDAINSNDTVEIKGGTFTIATGDDGVHADANLLINGGDFTITECFEGIESSVITINNGTFHIASRDDGLNVAGGNDGSGMNGPPGRPGQDNFTPPSSSGSYYLYIKGGYIYIEADGDGIDSNGSVEMTGGVVLVNGPTSNSNGALDYLGSCTISGGFLLAVGSAGMAQAPSQTSTQHWVRVYFDSALQAGTLVHLQTGSGDEVFTFRPTKRYQSVVFSSPELENGAAYNVYYGGSYTGSQIDGLYSDGSYSPGTKYASFTF